MTASVINRVARIFKTAPPPDMPLAGRLDENDELLPIYSFLEEIDATCDSAKFETKRDLFDVFSAHSGAVTSLLLREMQKDDGRAKKEILKLILPRLLEIVDVHQDQAEKAGLELANEVLSEISRVSKAARKQKTAEERDLDRRFAAAKKRLKEKKPGARGKKSTDLLTAQTALATDQFVTGMKQEITRLMSGGLSKEAITSQVKTDVTTQGRQTGAYFNAVSSDVSSHFRKVADDAMQEAFAAQNLEVMRWVAFFTKTCPDCSARHQLVKKYDEWKSEGLPRSGVTVCRQHCHCVLLPEEYKIETSQPSPRYDARTIERAQRRKKTGPKPEPKPGPKPETKPETKPVTAAVVATMEKEFYKIVHPLSGVTSLPELYDKVKIQHPNLSVAEYKRILEDLNNKEIIDFDAINDKGLLKRPEFVISTSLGEIYYVSWAKGAKNENN